jgi:hypothetical protein
MSIRLPGPFLVRFLLWLAIFFCSPLPPSAWALSFRLEVLSPAPISAELPYTRQYAEEFSHRVVARLVAAEFREPLVWFCDDYRIARVTVGLARQGCAIPFVEATYTVLGCHPDKVWPNIVAHRKANLGREYDANDNALPSDWEKFWGEGSSPKKPVKSVRLKKLRDQRAA